MNFAYTAQQEDLRRQSLEFGAREQEPFTARRCKARTYTRQDWNQLAEAGYTRICVQALCRCCITEIANKKMYCTMPLPAEVLWQTP